MSVHTTATDIIAISNKSMIPELLNAKSSSHSIKRFIPSPPFAVVVSSEKGVLSSIADKLHEYQPLLTAIASSLLPYLMGK